MSIPFSHLSTTVWPCVNTCQPRVATANYVWVGGWWKLAGGRDESSVSPMWRRGGGCAGGRGGYEVWWGWGGMLKPEVLAGSRLVDACSLTTTTITTTVVVVGGGGSLLYRCDIDGSALVCRQQPSLPAVTQRAPLFSRAVISTTPGYVRLTPPAIHTTALTVVACFLLLTDLSDQGA